MICKFLAIMNQTMSIMFCLSKDSRGYSEKLGHPIESSWYKLLPQDSISFYEYDIIISCYYIKVFVVLKPLRSSDVNHRKLESPSDKSE